jgi:hypothetical protein
VSDINWSEAEKKTAGEAFQKAYDREIQTLLEEFRNKAVGISDLDDIWKLHDFLSAKRHEIDGKYDYRYSVLIFVFAKLVKEEWLSLEELQGLEKDKRAKIAALSRI